ncbi:MAG: protoheme IX farnesyltransferase [Candidatus Marinimicrobia bacterium]|nr:protoheme IX farnesyltransferase [Candidatus Neomarinimicrobiota bacterium]MBL7059696.1 protoheme IX farnesyltransferase [Candidatus Neomarinimicrobiota bacterium]
MKDVIRKKAKLYWPLIKSLQTGLLLVTGIAGFVSARCPVISWQILTGLTGSLFLAISGSTVLNMVYDRDIDAKMPRTAHRPIVTGAVTKNEALILGIILSCVGVVWAMVLSLQFGIVVLMGLFLDAVVYTIWLKRRTPWSIVWGGISGGMPILAGRVLGTGHIDMIGILFAFAILLWIPTHILTFSIRYKEDYISAGIPTFPSWYGVDKTRIIIALASIGAAIAIAVGIFSLGLSLGYLRMLLLLSFGLIILAVTSVYNPSDKTNFLLFKYASVYMLSAMLIISIGSF